MKLSSAALLFFLTPLHAEMPGPYLVKDIRAGSSGGIPDFSRFAATGDTVLFAATDGALGYELWKSDGTAAGTALVKDIRPGSSGSEPFWPLAAGGVVYFTAGDGLSGLELWKSNGTPAGTVMVANFNGSKSSRPHAHFAKGSTLYFTVESESTGIELWKTDGTSSGTTLISDIAAGASSSVPNPGVELGGIYYFTAQDPACGRELWRTDGTSVGTYRVKDINPGSASADPAELVVAGGALYFAASDGVHGRELWRSNGTAAGTFMVKDFAPGPGSGSIMHPAAAGPFVYFSAKEADNYSNWGFWRSDGTAAGTVKLLSIYNYLGTPTAVGNVVYFNAQVIDNPARNWKSDGTLAGTVPIAEASSRSSRQYPWGTGFYSIAGDMLRQNDGSSQFSYQVGDLTAGSTIYIPSFEPLSKGGKLYFQASGQGQGNELFAFDFSLPSIARPEVIGITKTSAVLKGAVNPNGFATTAQLQFGLTAGYGTTLNLPLSPGNAGTLFRSFGMPMEGLLPGRTYYYKVTAASERGSRTATGTFATLPAREDWRMARFGVAEDGGTAADHEDPDGDGSVNLIEYAFSLDPLKHDAHLLPKGRQAAGIQIFEVEQPPDIADVTYGVEWSDTMQPGSWTAAEDLGSGNHHIFEVSTLDVPKRFMRWTVTPR